MPCFDECVEAMCREDLQALHVQKFKAMLNQIYSRNRFYTAKLRAADLMHLDDFRSLDDLLYFPLTLKCAFVQVQSEVHPFNTNATFPEADYIRFHRTSETIGVPLRVIDVSEIEAPSIKGHGAAGWIGSEGLRVQRQLM